MTINNFIKSRPYLIWYVQDYDNLSTDAIVEAVLNYGTFNDIKKIFNIIGLKKVALIFRRQIRGQRTRNNYNPKIRNYFKLYFDKYA